MLFVGSFVQKSKDLFEHVLRSRDASPQHAVAKDDDAFALTGQKAGRACQGAHGLLTDNPECALVDFA